MKKVIASLLVLSLIVTAFSGCGNKNVEIDPDAEAEMQGEVIDDTNGEVEIDVGGGEDWEYGDIEYVDAGGAEDELLGEKFKPEIQPDGTLDEQSAAKVRRAIIESIKGKEAYNIDTDVSFKLRVAHTVGDDVEYEDTDCTQTASSQYDGEKAHIQVSMNVGGEATQVEAYYTFGKNFIPYTNPDTVQVWSKMVNPNSPAEPHWYTKKQTASIVTGPIIPITAEFVNKMNRTKTTVPDEEQSARLIEVLHTVDERNKLRLAEEETTEESTEETSVTTEAVTDEDGNIIEATDTSEDETTEETTEDTTDETTEEATSAEETTDVATDSEDTTKDAGSRSESNDSDTKNQAEFVGDVEDDSDQEEVNPLEGIYQFSGDISARFIDSAMLSGLGLDAGDTTYGDEHYLHVDIFYNVNTNEIISVSMDMSKLHSDSFEQFLKRLPESSDDNVGSTLYTVAEMIYNLNFSNYNDVEEIEIPDEVKEKAVKDTDVGIGGWGAKNIFIWF